RQSPYCNRSKSSATSYLRSCQRLSCHPTACCTLPLQATSPPRREELRSQESKTWQRLKSEQSRVSLDTSWMAVGAIKMTARSGRESLPSSSAHDHMHTLPHYAPREAPRLGD